VERCPHRVAADTVGPAALDGRAEVTVAPDGLLIQGAKLFDGHRFRPSGCLLVAAGLPTAAALAAATSAPAAALGLPDRGTLTPGLRADLLLVDGDPERDITRSRHVAQVWRAGRRAT
jgi:cytosine/adenosine deaminase-related metal-dependent hydrolase